MASANASLAQNRQEKWKHEDHVCDTGTEHDRPRRRGIQIRDTSPMDGNQGTHKVDQKTRRGQCDTVWRKGALRYRIECQCRKRDEKHEAKNELGMVASSKIAYSQNYTDQEE
ncbi:MAG: hypothetical protein U5K38_17040 [Woeseiaceae bacterium]|nr:hypothetical protein [Woeseiaceae bacterium]